MRKALATALLLPTAAVALTGCGLFGPTTYEPEERAAIEVDAGEEFTLSVPANPAIAEYWYLVKPHPDRDVVERVGKRLETEPSDPDVIGDGDGTLYFDFKGVRPGTTEIKLLHCPAVVCTGTKDNPEPHPTSSMYAPVPTATGTPGNDPAYFIYKVTVR
ncbi:protease inhibitor I42 family protein [Streptomyces boluensis]|uniref:Proteinase inhibitor I42 chagasin domain-containing protein n=1 Tax=Streptomyces boluensis TaxID=1775135 RepID=A0A964XPE2_9ACTN|nr:protease inhibitor I42 family protein [Streptomyces boluensis]NBE54682.1 hypothetical protein [Streptomyces boluensis]